MIDYFTVDFSLELCKLGCYYYYYYYDQQRD